MTETAEVLELIEVFQLAQKKGRFEEVVGRLLVSAEAEERRRNEELRFLRGEVARLEWELEVGRRAHVCSESDGG